MMSCPNFGISGSGLMRPILTNTRGDVSVISSFLFQIWITCCMFCTGRKTKYVI